MLKKFIILGIIIVLIGGTAFFILKRGNRDKTAGIEMQYDFETVGRVDLSEKVDATGSVVATNNTDIYPAYSATVSRIVVKVGENVRKGQLLLVLDSTALATDWASDESAVRQAESNLSLANQELSRTKSLFAAEGATRSDLDSAQNKYDLALDQLNLAKFKLSQLQNNPDHANYIAANHRSLNICAPFDGQVAWLNIREGDPVTTQTSLITVIGADSLMVEAKVDETDIKTVKPGQSAVITMNDAEQTAINGTVYGVGSVGTNNSGVIEYPVRIKVTSGDAVIKPQMSVDVTITTREYPNAIAVPSAAVVERRGHAMVPVRQGNQVAFVRVTTGVSNDTYTEITNGLHEGDVIATQKTTSAASQSNGNQNGANNNGTNNKSGNNRNNRQGFLFQMH